jgi:hypothetical protein
MPRPFFLRANYFASYGATRLAVPRSSEADATTPGSVRTNVNLLPSGAMNRSICEPPVAGMVPVQSAFTLCVLEECCLELAPIGE